jgi:hypothetical protein
MSADKKHCEGRIKSEFGWAGTRCNKTASLEHEGKHYCKLHHPPTIAAKREAQNAKWRAQWEARDKAAERAHAAAKERDRRAALFPELLEALQAAEKVLYGDELKLVSAAIAKATGVPA